eukprot:jgi/Bigna1/77015/fgenesh1_pg.45_\
MLGLSSPCSFRALWLMPLILSALGYINPINAFARKGNAATLGLNNGTNTLQKKTGRWTDKASTETGWELLGYQVDDGFLIPHLATHGASRTKLSDILWNGGSVVLRVEMIDDNLELLFHPLYRGDDEDEFSGPLIESLTNWNDEYKGLAEGGNTAAYEDAAIKRMNYHEVKRFSKTWHLLTKAFGSKGNTKFGCVWVLYVMEKERKTADVSLAIDGNQFGVAAFKFWQDTAQNGMSKSPFVWSANQKVIKGIEQSLGVTCLGERIGSYIINPSGTEFSDEIEPKDALRTLYSTQFKDKSQFLAKEALDEAGRQRRARDELLALVEQYISGTKTDPLKQFVENVDLLYTQCKKGEQTWLGKHAPVDPKVAFRLRKFLIMFNDGGASIDKAKKAQQQAASSDRRERDNALKRYKAMKSTIALHGTFSLKTREPMLVIRMEDALNHMGWVCFHVSGKTSTTGTYTIFDEEDITFQENFDEWKDDHIAKSVKDAKFNFGTLEKVGTSKLSSMMTTFSKMAEDDFDDAVKTMVHDGYAEIKGESQSLCVHRLQWPVENKSIVRERRTRLADAAYTVLRKKEHEDLQSVNAYVYGHVLKWLDEANILATTLLVKSIVPTENEMKTLKYERTVDLLRKKGYYRR